MIHRTPITFSIIMLMFLSCNSRDKELPSKEKEDSSSDDNWIEVQINKQLGKTITEDSIELFGLPIEDLPEQIYKYPNIRHLRIDCIEPDCMKSLSKRISEFKYLETLIISKSALKELPIEVGSLVNLKKLMILGGGRLNSIPSEISNLDKLEELNLWRNSLITLPIELDKMRNLKTVTIGQNQFSKTYFEELVNHYPGIEIKKFPY